MFAIEKGVPLPKRERRGGRQAAYPFRAMEVGDSFFVSCAKDDLTRRQNRLSSLCRDAVHDGKKFATRQVEGGVRVWRVK